MELLVKVITLAFSWTFEAADPRTEASGKRRKIYPQYPECQKKPKKQAEKCRQKNKKITEPVENLLPISA